MHISASLPTVVSVTQWKHIVFRSTNPWRGHGMFQSLVGVAYWQHVQVTCIPCCFCFPYLGIGSNVTNVDRMSTKTLSFPKRRFFLDICKICFPTNGVIFVVTFEASTNFFATNLFWIISSANFSCRSSNIWLENRLLLRLQNLHYTDLSRTITNFGGLVVFSLQLH